VVDGGSDPFERLLSQVEESGLDFTVHRHRPTRTIEEAARSLDFEVTRIVKTVAFRTRRGLPILAALRGTRRVDYALLARLAKVKRRDLSALAPDEVRALIGLEPGSVSPLPLREGQGVYLDLDVLAIGPTLYCGLGRPDRTLEIAPKDLVELAGATLGPFSKP